MSPPSSIPWQNIKALTFDIYGTLVDWDRGLVRAARATVLGPFLPSDDNAVLTALETHLKRIEREQPRMRKSEINAEGLRLYAKDLGIVENGKLTGEEVVKAAGEFGGCIGAFEAFDDSVDAIRRLSKHFAVLVPVTNMDHFSYNGTLSGPLAGCPFTTSYLAEDIGSYKPDLANFHYLLDHLKADYGIEKDQICHVAQSLFHDHEPAKKMGLRSVWIDRYDVLSGMGRHWEGQGVGKKWEDVQQKFGMQGRLTSLKELADLVERELDG